MMAKVAYETAMDCLKNNPTLILIQESVRKGLFSCTTERVYDQIIFERLGYRFKWSSTMGTSKCRISWDHFK